MSFAALVGTVGFVALAGLAVGRSARVGAWAGLTACGYLAVMTDDSIAWGVLLLGLVLTAFGIAGATTGAMSGGGSSARR